MKIIVAPNALKGTLSAFEAAEAISEGIRRAAPRIDVVLCPIADGGDGTREVLVRALGGETRAASVCDPLGRSGSREYGLVDGGRTALIDVATASGLGLLAANELNPLYTSSFGTGQLLLAAVSGGAENAIIGVGGSATVDGGTGLLAALGARWLDAQGRALVPSGAALSDIADLDLSALSPAVRGVPIVVACDVDNPLLGIEGAARVYGPQKGATPEAIERLESGLDHLSSVLLRATGKDVRGLRFAGAAGGIAAALWAVLGAKLLSGIDFVLDRLDFARVVQGADAVVTAEGRLDEQSLRSKGPVGVARRAEREGVPTLLIAGSIAPGFDATRAPFLEVLTLTSGQKGAATTGNAARTRLCEVSEGVPRALGPQAKKPP